MRTHATSRRPCTSARSRRRTASSPTSSSTGSPTSRIRASNTLPDSAAVIGNVIGVLFDGLAYGSLLFIIAVGLSVTLGLMNFVNLAHGAFAMVGGYVCVLLMTRLGVPYLLTLPIAFIVSAIVGVLLERTLYQRLYGANHLDQVLFSIGLVFMSIAIATYFFGAS